MSGPFTFPVARALPFEANRSPQYDGNQLSSGIVSENAQDAIEEVKVTAPGTGARYTAMLGFDGNATNGRWLEFLTNVSSNLSGHVIAEPSTMRSLSVAVQVNTTCELTIYKNGIILESLILSAQRKNNKINLNHSLLVLDELSVRVTSGNCIKPVFNIFIRVN